ncbi:MAG: beta-glucosidase family protein [Gaiellaceae bacterium]
MHAQGRRWIARVVVLVAVAAVGATGETQQARADTACPWMNTSLSADQRAQALLDASTWEQKIRWLAEPAANNPATTHIGGFGISADYPAQVPCTPTIQYTDGPWGVSGPTGVTAFPVPIAQTASWDPQLSWDKGEAQGDEAFRKHRNVLLGPGVNIARHPFNGRNSEYMGEDPYLAGKMAVPWIRALQTANPTEPVEAVVKHFLGNDQELSRTTSNDIIDARTLHEIYGLPFAIALQEGGPYGVMCAFNQVNGVYACESSPVLRDYLKGELGFTGWVVDDFFGDHSTAPSLRAGLDQELVGPRFYSPSSLTAALALDPGLQLLIDDSAFRVVRAHIAAGLFDHPLPATPEADVSTAAHKAVAQRMAEEGTVLLKNDGGILPLSVPHKTIAVIGPTASATPTNGVSARTVCTASAGRVVDCSSVAAPLDAITARAAKAGDTVTYASGSDLAAAAATAKAADVAIVFGYYTEGEGTDRTNINLDNGGDTLVSAVAAANPNTVVVLETGSAVLMPWIDQVKGVFEAWYPGVEQGPALAGLLFGDVNPSGKLPVSFPKSVSDLPIQSAAQYPGVVVNGIRQYEYSEGPKVGYRWYDSQAIKPLFPFGFGLSYTTFAYRHLQVTPTVVQDTKPIRVRFQMTNTGSTAGTETAQVYVTLPSSTGEPSKRLTGWSRVTLQPGETQNVEVTIDPTSADHPLSYWDTATDSWATAEGSYTVSVGGSEQSTAQTDAIRVHPSGSANNGK